jgi:hypothetical protein
MSGTLVAWCGWVWTLFSERPALRRGASVLGLIVLVPMTVYFLLVFVATWNGTEADCEGYILCFTGPKAATVIGAPAFVAAPLAALMVVGLRYPRRRLGRVCSTLALTVTTGLVAAFGAAILFTIDWTG